MADTAQELLAALRQAEEELTRAQEDIVVANQTLAARTQEIAEASRARDQVVAHFDAIKVNIALLEVDQKRLTDTGDRLRAEHTDVRQRIAALRHELRQSKAELAATVQPAVDATKGGVK